MSNRTLLPRFAAACLILVQSIAPVQAAVISTEHYLATVDRTVLVATIDAAFSRDDVREQMIALGVDPAHARARIDALSDAELRQLAGQLETLPAGGDSVLAVIGVVFLVLLILELVGVIDIFKKN